MARDNAIAAHWGKGDIYARIVSALERTSKSLDALTVQDLAPVDQIHACGLLATVDLGERLPIKANYHILDIGCGLGGPARYLAQRYQCRVSGIDITKPFVEAARKLTRLVGMDERVTIVQGDGYHLPYTDGVFDGTYCQHVTMNVADRAKFFAEAYRVLKPGAFFALTEHGLGPAGEPHYPLPWSEDGTGSYLLSPVGTRFLLEAAGFADIVVEHIGSKYLAAYKRGRDMAVKGTVPPLGVHIFMGETAPQKTRNAARNIEEGRTHPVRVVCRKPALTPNGKLDYRALPAPQHLRPELEAVYVAPKFEIEHHIATVWQEVLGLEQAGVQDNFFDLGGNSLLLAQVQSKLQEIFHRDIPIIDLFERPTINALVEYVAQQERGQAAVQPSEELVENLRVGKNRLKQLSQRRQRTRGNQ